MRALKAIGSWWTTAALAVVVWGAYFHFTFGERPYDMWMDFLLHKPSGIAVYIALVLNLVAASVRAAASRIKTPPVTPETIRAMDAHIVVEGDEDAIRAAIGSLMGRAGLGGSGADERAVCARRGRLSVLPGTVLRAGIVIFMVAVMASSHMRTSGQAVMHEGDRAELAGVGVSLNRINVTLEDDYLQMGEGGEFALKGLSAAVQAGGETLTVGGGRPAGASGRYFRLTHAGYAQPLSLRGYDITADIDVFPPGKTDRMTLPSGETVSIALEPARTLKKGIVTGKVYDLVTPAYRLEFSGGAAGPVVVSSGGAVVFDGGTMAAGPKSLYVELQSVHDPALPYIGIGILTALAGAALMLLRFFWYERRLFVFRDGGRLYAGYGEEFYRRWGIMKFRRWTEDMVSESETRTASGTWAGRK